MIDALFEFLVSLLLELLIAVAEMIVEGLLFLFCGLLGKLVSARGNFWALATPLLAGLLAVSGSLWLHR